MFIKMLCTLYVFVNTIALCWTLMSEHFSTLLRVAKHGVTIIDKLV